MRDAFRDQIRLEVRKAYFEYDTARQQIEVARGAIAQADESLRINQNRYEAGLKTVNELLQVEEAAHRAKADYWQAVYRLQTSYAGVEAGNWNPFSKLSCGDAMIHKSKVVVQRSPARSF